MIFFCKNKIITFALLCCSNIFAYKPSSGVKADKPASIIVNFFPYDYYSGLGNSAIKQHEALMASGVPTIFINRDTEKTKHLSKILCTSLEDGYKKLEAVIEEKKDAIAIIHCQEICNVPHIKKIAEKYNIPIVLTVHYPQPLGKSIRTATAGIVCVNKEIAAFQQKLNADDGISTPVIAIPPFFNDAPLRTKTTPTINRDEYFKSQFNIDLKPCPLLLKVANFYPIPMHKNHALLFCAMYDLIHKRNRPVQVVLAGKGKLMRICKKAVEDLNIQDYVYFVGTTDQTAQLYQYADINLLSSSNEGFGLVLLEGGFFKKPSIVARTGCGSGGWLVIDHETGFLFENNNAADLADKIEYALSHPEEAKACGQRLYEKVINEFLPNKIVQDLLKFYQLVQPKFILPIQ